MRVYRVTCSGRSSALTTTSFDVLRSVVFFYIKSPLRVEEAGLQELIPTTWWPHHSGREVGGGHSKDWPAVSVPPGTWHASSLPGLGWE